MLGTREGIINGRDLGVEVRKLPKVVTSCCLGDKMCPEREGSQRQSSLGDRDLEHSGPHEGPGSPEPDAFQPSFKKSACPCLSMKFWHHLLVIRGKWEWKVWSSQPVEDPWRPGGRAEGKASTCGLLSVTKSSVSASGSRVSLPQGKDQITRIAHKDRITRKCRTHWAGAALFS